MSICSPLKEYVKSAAGGKQKFLKGEGVKGEGRRSGPCGLPGTGSRGRGCGLGSRAVRRGGVGRSLLRTVLSQMWAFSSCQLLLPLALSLKQGPWLPRSQLPPGAPIATYLLHKLLLSPAPGPLLSFTFLGSPISVFCRGRSISFFFFL